MIVTETAAGTPVVDLTAEEYGAYLESEVRRLTGRTVAAFVQACEADELDDSDPAVSELTSNGWAYRLNPTTNRLIPTTS